MIKASEVFWTMTKVMKVRAPLPLSIQRRRQIQILSTMSRRLRQTHHPQGQTLLTLFHLPTSKPCRISRQKPQRDGAHRRLASLAASWLSCCHHRPQHERCGVNTRCLSRRRTKARAFPLRIVPNADAVLSRPTSASAEPLITALSEV